MKKIFIALLFSIPVFSWSQNLQLHYDFGTHEDGFSRNYFVGTFEYFQPDTLGYTFLFSDFEFDSPDKPRGVSLAYFELARSFYIPGLGGTMGLKNLMVHLEYNDGNLIFPVNDSTILGQNLRSTWLGGVEYGTNLGDLTINAMLLYKYTRGSAQPDAQFTLVWYYPMLNNRLNFTGYFDIWSQDNFYHNEEEKILIFYSEPQLWYNFNSHLSVGSELKLSKNFIQNSRRIEAFPTLGLKWQF